MFKSRSEVKEPGREPCKREGDARREPGTSGRRRSSFTNGSEHRPSVWKDSGDAEGAGGLDAQAAAAGDALGDVSSSSATSSSWAGLIDDSLRAATAPPKDERQSPFLSQHRRNGGEAAHDSDVLQADAHSWLKDEDAVRQAFSGANRAQLSSAHGCGVHDLNHALRHKRGNSADKTVSGAAATPAPSPHATQSTTGTPDKIKHREPRSVPGGASTSQEAIEGGDAASDPWPSLHAAHAAPARCRQETMSPASASPSLPLKASSDTSAGLGVPREAYLDSLAQTREMLQGNVVPSGRNSAARPRSRPASSRQVDTSEVFPMAPAARAGSSSRDRPRSARLQTGQLQGQMQREQLATANRDPVVSSPSPDSPECAIKVFGGSEVGDNSGKGSALAAATALTPANGSETSTTVTQRKGLASREAPRKEYRRGQSLERHSAQGPPQHRTKSVSRDRWQMSSAGSCSSVPGRSGQSGPWQAWGVRQAERPASQSMSSMIHRAQRIYQGASAAAAESSGKAQVSIAKGACSSSMSSGLASGSGASRFSTSSQGSRRVLSAVPRTGIEIPGMEREALWRRRQRQQEREHSAHPQLRVSDATSTRGNGPVKATRPNLSCNARTNSRDMDARAFFTGAGRSGGSKPGGGKDARKEDADREDRGGAQDDNAIVNEHQGHPWSWTRDYPRLERPPSRQRHPTQSLHLSETFPAAGTWKDQDPRDSGPWDSGPCGPVKRIVSNAPSSGRDSKIRPITQGSDPHSPTGTSFGDKIELRPGTSVVAAAADEWASARHPASPGGTSDQGELSDSDNSSSAAVSVSSVDSTHSFIASGTHDTLTWAAESKMEVESVSDVSSPSGSPIQANQLQISASKMSQQLSSFSRQDFARPSLSRDGSSAVKVYRPASRKACTVNADGTPTPIIVPIAAPASAPLQHQGGECAARPESVKSSRPAPRLALSSQWSRPFASRSTTRPSSSSAVNSSPASMIYSKDSVPGVMADDTHVTSDEKFLRSSTREACDKAGQRIPPRLVQSAKIIRQSRPETARGLARRQVEAAERSSSTLGFHSPGAMAANSPLLRPSTASRLGREPSAADSSSAKDMDPELETSCASGHAPDTPSTPAASKRGVLLTSSAFPDKRAGSDSEEWMGNMSVDRRATGLGETAPDRDFDFGAIGGCPWAGSSSSSEDAQFLLDQDDDSDWSDGQEELDMRPDTAPAANVAHYSTTSTMLAETSPIVTSAATRPAGLSPPPSRVRPDSAAPGRDVELDPLKKRDPWFATANQNSVIASLRTEGRGAWARPTSAQSAFRPKSASRPEASVP